MKVPLSWLKDYVEIKEEPERIAWDLLLSGTKVESIEEVGSEPVFDFEITPNRADCLSVIGLAREIAAIYERKLILPSVLSETQAPAGGQEASFEVADRHLCPHYSIGTIDSIKINKSPRWLSERLEKSGIRSINNVVDVTNYVMLETGQPMHAFDADKIAGRMLLRASKQGESLTTLDNVERQLPTGSIIIEDSEKLIDLAGLMGGQVSEVDSNTKTVLLHVPIYDPVTIRRTSQALGLRTEASLRFEKQLDPAGHRFAFERAAELLRLLAQGQLTSKIKSTALPTKERKIQATTTLFEKVLGIPLTADQICGFLGRLEFATKLKGDRLQVGIPSFRTDINTPIDLTEEVGRLAGYNQMPKTLPNGPLPTRNLPRKDFEKEAKQILASLGLKEIYSNTLTSSQILENLGLRSENCLKVANRLSIDYEYLRPSLIVGLLLAARLNIVNFDRFNLFEIGRVFSPGRTNRELPNQPKKIAALFVNSSFRPARGVLETFNQRLGVTISLAESKSSLCEPTADVLIGEKVVGTIGRLKPSILERFDIFVPTFWFEIDFEAVKANIKEIQYKPLPRFPVVKENISLFLPAETNFSAVLAAVKSGGGKNIYRTQLLEDTIVNNNRSILLGVEYYHPTHTLRTDEITRIRKAILEELRKAGARIRTQEG